MNEITRYKAIIVDADRAIKEQAERIRKLESAARDALDALKEVNKCKYSTVWAGAFDTNITALRAALEGSEA